MLLRRITQHVQRPVIAGLDPAIQPMFVTQPRLFERSLDYPIKSGDDEKGDL